MKTQPPAIKIPSQGASRSLSFLLDDPANGRYEAIGLHIRPEDLSVTSPSRVTPHQTFGAPWVDSFGPGLRTIQISGTTGWRGTATEDALTHFERLHEIAFKHWHKGRADAINKGISPDRVRLIFANDLDRMVSTVVPLSFVLRRNKTRPLLVQYQISMLEIMEGISDDLYSWYQPGELVGPQPGVLAPTAVVAAQKSMQSSINEITKTIAEIGDKVDAAIGAPVRAFTEVTADILQKALDGGILGILGYGGASPGKLLDLAIAPWMNIATNLSRAASNIYETVYTVMSASAREMAKIARLYKEFNNAFCILMKIKDLFRKKWLDMSKLFGSSTCSSTGGGRPQSPLAFENPFYKLAPAQSSPVAQTTAAATATKSLADIDIMKSAGALVGDIRKWVTDAVSGTRVAPQ